MITLLEYLQHKDEGEWRDGHFYNPHLKEIQEYNKSLIEAYPFLRPRNRWTDKTAEDYDYTYTELDAMPEGWRIRFGEEMVEEISQELKKYNFEDRYRIVQIKEKWGGLRWYDGGVPINSAVHNIIRKYERLSFKICIECGDLAVYETVGYVLPYCENCIDERDHYRELTVEDYLK